MLPGGGPLSTGKTHDGRNPTDKQKAERGRAQILNLGAAAGSALRRPTYAGVPGVKNARVVGGVIQHVTLIRVTRIRLRRAEENAAQHRESAP